MAPMDIFKDISREFLAVFIATKEQIFLTGIWEISTVFVVTKEVIFI